MSACNCDKGVNGYFKWVCVSNKCKECKFLQPSTIKCQESSQPVVISLFEILKYKYKVMDKITEEVTEKISSSTERERVSKIITWKELHQVLIISKKSYLMLK